MSDRSLGKSTALVVATVAVMTAVTAVFTIMIRVPIPGTRGGYFNLSDVAVYFTAFALGPFAGSVAGGLGTALADVISGAALWAPISLLAHGLEGLAAGLIAGAFRSRRGWGFVGGSVAGSVIMVGLYLAGGLLVEGAATLVQIPPNIVQTAVGAVVGSGLAVVVHRAYPPLRDLRW